MKRKINVDMREYHSSDNPASSSNGVIKKRGSFLSGSFVCLYIIALLKLLIAVSQQEEKCQCI